MNIVEKNRLIAGFMGLKPESKMDERYRGVPDIVYKYQGVDYRITNTATPENMFYHKSFDWLMPVVGRISELPDIYGQESFLLIRDELCTGRILAVFEAVVNFIEDYNKKKNKMQSLGEIESLKNQFDTLVHKAQVDIENKAPFDLIKPLIDEFVSEEDILFDLPYIDFSDSEGNGRIHAVITGMNDKGKLICRTTGNDFGEDRIASLYDVPAHSLFYLHELLNKQNDR